MSELIFKIKGGTGNQLFQAAAAASLAKLYDKSCKFTSKNIGRNRYKRKLEIRAILENLLIRQITAIFV